MQWGKMADELSYQGRSGEAGDELGSRVIAARMVEFMMKLCFLVERKYFPYSKWFGTAFSYLNCAKHMQPLLLSILQSDNWQERQHLIAEPQSMLGEMHNSLHITESQSTELAEFPGRHYKVLDVSQYIRALSDAIQDKKLKELHDQLGSVDQFIQHARINHVDDVTRQMKCIIR